MPSNSDLVREAWDELYSTPLPYEPELKYTARFAGLNANIRLGGGVLRVGMSKRWRGVDRQIQKGLVQSLIVRLRRDRKRTMSIDLYRAFLRHAHIAAPKTESDPLLAASFSRVNEDYFSGTIQMTNLVWGEGRNRLGFYDYGRDTISISRLLAKDERLLDYVMYHEMLHKKHKFSGNGSRTLHHSAAFRDDERRFKNAALLEKELGRLVRGARRPRLFGWL